ncbi:unnamed protein product, partial [Closterium sp. NIES-65]
ASDRFNISSQLEHMQARYVGTGHADTTKYFLAVSIHRDSYASYVGYHFTRCWPSLLSLCLCFLSLTVPMFPLSHCAYVSPLSLCRCFLSLTVPMFPLSHCADVSSLSLCLCFPSLTVPMFPLSLNPFPPSPSEWAVNIHRDSYASYVGHHPLLAFFAVAENESIGRERYNFMQRMLLPCGLPPDRDEE